MRITKTVLAVLQRIQELDGCGVNALDGIIFTKTQRQMQLRTGQYLGRMARKGLVRKEYHEYRGKRGQLVACGVTYHLTDLSREILNSER